MDWQELVNKAGAFHGHVGPFLIIGLRIGLVGMEKLGVNGFDKKLHAEIHCPLKTPYSCLIDGIQISTGCTRGKRNLEEIDDKQIFVKFYHGEKIRKISLKQDAEKFIGELEERARKVMEIPTKELLELEVI